MTTRGLTEVDAVFNSFNPNMKGADLSVNTTAAVNNGASIQFYDISTVDDGSGLLLDNGNYANPVSNSMSVIPQTVSGTLTPGGVINQIRDSGTFTMPLAALSPDKTILVVELPDTYAAQEPTIITDALDLFENRAGTDTTIKWVGTARLTLTSNGSNKWSL